MLALDSGFKTTGAKSVYMSIEVLVRKLVRGGWGNLSHREGRELISDSKWPPGYQVSGGGEGDNGEYY